MELHNAIMHIIEGNSIIIMGSGASYGAKNTIGPLPAANGLAELLYSKCCIDPDDKNDLQDAAQCYEEMFSANALIQELRIQFSCASFTPSHEVIYTQPWTRYYTTNYDDVALLAAAKSGKRLTPVTLSSDFKKSIQQDNLCIHINGHIGNLNDNTLHNEFKLTTSSYLSQENILKSPWGDFLYHDLETAKCIVILGLSLKYDLDLSRIIFNKDFKDKTIVISSPTLTENARNRLSRFGSVFAIGVDGFADEIKKALKAYKPSKRLPTERLYSAFTYEHHRRFDVTPPTPDSIFRMAFAGQIDDSLFYKLKGQYQGIIDRNAFSDLKQAVLENNKLIFVHADMGNGKTICLYALRFQLASEDVHVFVLENADSPKLKEEIDAIVDLSKTERVVVIIDDYTNYLEVIREFALLNNDSILFVLAARTALNHSKMPTILRDFRVENGQKTKVLDVNRLDKNALNNCVELFDRYGLFGIRSRLNREEKLKYLSEYRGGASKFQSIMLDVLQSDVIKRKVVDLINVIKADSKQYHSAVLLILLIKVMNLPLSAYDIARISEISVATDAVFTTNPAVHELVSFGNGGNLSIKAPVTARYVLQKVADPMDIIRVLYSLASYAAQYAEINKYSGVLTSIISYSHINSFLKGFKNPEQLLMAYYDELSKCEYYRNNNFFWLQYAISCIEVKRFDRAQQYLNTAYGLIPEGFVPFQINNQQARLYLERIYNEQSSAPDNDFQKAHRLLMIPIVSPKDDEYNVIKLFGYYYRKKMRGIMEKANYTEGLQTACREAFERTEKFIKNNPLYKKELKDMQRLLLEAAMGD